MKFLLDSLALAVVHDSLIVRRGLASALSEHPSLRVLLNVACADTYLAQPSIGRPRIVFSDLTQGLALLKRSSAAGKSRLQSDVVVVVVAASLGELDTRDALRAGVRGLLPLDCAADQLLACAHTVAASRSYVVPQFTAQLVQHIYTDPLTRREQQVLHYIYQGCCNKSIARELDIAVGTVKTHVKAVLSKLEASSRSEAAAVAGRRGLVKTVQAAL